MHRQNLKHGGLLRAHVESRDKVSSHLLIVAQKASEFIVAIEQQSKIEGGYTTTKNIQQEEGKAL